MDVGVSDGFGGGRAELPMSVPMACEPEGPGPDQ